MLFYSLLLKATFMVILNAGVTAIIFGYLLNMLIKTSHQLLSGNFMKEKADRVISYITWLIGGVSMTIVTMWVYYNPILGQEKGYELMFGGMDLTNIILFNIIGCMLGVYASVKSETLSMFHSFEI